MQGGLPGAFLFSIGLICVCLFELNLYTGKICYFTDELTNQNCITMITILFGNICMAIFIGILASISASGDAINFANQIVATKLAKNPIEIIIASIFCNIFIYIAVNAWKKTKNYIGLVIIILSIICFILTGSEHCIANCFYFAFAGMFSQEVIAFMLFCILGNTIGGIAVHYLF